MPSALRSPRSESAPQIRIYAPGSPLKNPLAFLAEVWAGLLASRELAWRLTMRDFSAQYRQSYAGYVWAFLPPLAGAFTFILLRAGGAVSIDAPQGISYAAFALTGTIMWQTFLGSMNAPIATLTSSKSMLIKINFPREALIISPIQMSFISLGIRLCILIPVLIFFQFPLNTSILLAPIGLISLVLLGNAIGVLLAPVAALFKDVGRGLGLISNFWMFLTPVVFPKVREGFLGTLMQINPVTHVLGTTRDWLTGTVNSAFLPGYFIVMGCVAVALFVGAVLFRVLLGRVVERLGM